ncbi:MAG: hypothetical protein Tsb0020_39410 [Haliangiales bacterium]
MRKTLFLLIAMSAVAWVGCGDDGGGDPADPVDARPPDASPADAAPPDAEPIDAAPPDAAPLATIGGDRPAPLFVPSSYDGQTPAPLLIMLHGYTASGPTVEDILQITAEAEARGFLYTYPDGTRDPSNARFWNATDACCDFADSAIDDVAYLRGLIDEVKANYAVDEQRVFLVGHSNGGFMSHRMACDAAEVIAAIVSVAGAQYDDPTNCEPSEPVAVLQIHGTADDVILYEGGAIPLSTTYPGAVETVETWATLGGCDLTATAGSERLDLDAEVEGDDTDVAIYNTACDPGGHAELWTTTDGPHVPRITDDFVPAVFDFLMAHPKPAAD